MNTPGISSPVHSHNPYHTTGFPLLVLNVEHRACTPFNEGFQVLHWHEEVQFVYVLQGIVHIRIYDEEFNLNPGDCMFINRTVLHHITEKEDCHYHSYIIPPRMLGFFPGSLMEQQEVEKIVSNPAFTHYLLHWDCPSHKPVLESVQALDTLYFCAEKQAHHEYGLMVRLVQMWFQFVSLTVPENAVFEANTRADSKNYDRIRTMIAFIHIHYSQPVSAEDIAGSAHISKTECLRCFQKFVRESPYHYLMKYRLHMSTSLLSTTGLSVTEIAMSVGFQSASSYISYFKKQYGKTPYQYRNAHKENGSPSES